MKEQKTVLSTQVNGETAIVMPITKLECIEDTATSVDSASDTDYVPIIDSADEGQMKKITVENLLSGVKSIANIAKSTADTAKTTATEAKTAATNAQTTANTAKSTADTAKTTATEAKTAATNAQSTANTAKSTADSAKTAAAEAKSAAETAQATASSAASASTPVAFSVAASAWTTLSTAFAGCKYKATITASSVTASDFPDVFFDSASIEAASSAGIIASAEAGVVALYAKSKPETALTGSYFIKKGAAS